MRKLNISAIILGITLLLLLFIRVNLEVSYKDEVDLLQSVIVVSKDISAKEKIVQLNATKQLGKKIIEELKVVNVLLLLVILFLLIVVYFYFKLYINRKRINNQSR